MDPVRTVGGQQQQAEQRNSREFGVVATLRKRFGFIKCCTRNLDLFFHFNDLQPGRVKASELKIGLEVQFTPTRVVQPDGSQRLVAMAVDRAEAGRVAFERVSAVPQLGQILELPTPTINQAQALSISCCSTDSYQQQPLHDKRHPAPGHNPAVPSQPSCSDALPLARNSPQPVASQLVPAVGGSGRGELIRPAATAPLPRPGFIRYIPAPGEVLHIPFTASDLPGCAAVHQGCFVLFHVSNNTRAFATAMARDAAAAAAATSGAAAAAAATSGAAAAAAATSGAAAAAAATSGAADAAATTSDAADAAAATSGAAGAAAATPGAADALAFSPLASLERNAPGVTQHFEGAEPSAEPGPVTRATSGAEPGAAAGAQGLHAGKGPSPSSLHHTERIGASRRRHAHERAVSVMALDAAAEKYLDPSQRLQLEVLRMLNNAFPIVYDAGELAAGKT